MKSEKVPCDICGCAEYERNMKQVGNMFLCIECNSLHAKTCEKCGESFIVSELIDSDYDSYDSRLCDKCLNITQV